MGCTLGRITGLESPRTIRQEGDKLRLAGEFAPTSVAEGVALAQQVIGYPSPDEEVVPFTYDATGAGGVLDGFYFVVSTQVDWAKLASGLFSWEAELMAVPGKQAPLVEVSCLGAVRTNVHSIVAGDVMPWVSIPGSADSYLSSVSGPNISATVAVDGGSVRRFDSNGSTELNDASVLYRVGPAEFYEAAALIEWTADAGTSWSAVTGRQSDTDPDALRLSNGLVRVSHTTGGVFVAESWDSAAEAWEATNFTMGTGSNPISTALMTDWSAALVTRNSPEAVTVGYVYGTDSPSTARGGTLWLTVRRGAYVIEAHWAARASAAALWSFYRTDSETGANVSTYGIEAASNDANGNKYLIATPNTANQDTTGTSGIYTASGNSFSFAFTPRNVSDAVGMYFAAMTHHQQVVAR